MPFSSGVLATVVFDETDPERIKRARDATTAIAIKGDAEAFFGLAMVAAEYLAEREEGLDNRGADARSAGAPLAADARSAGAPLAADARSAGAPLAADARSAGAPLAADARSAGAPLAADARSAGAPPGDLLGALVKGTLLGRPMDENERLGVVTVLFLGGLDTTRGAIGTLAARLATMPGLQDRMREPSWIKRDLDELLRVHAPVAVTARTAIAEVELGGVQLKPGDRLVLHYDSANRDESRFDRADEVRLGAQRQSNALFGLGIRRCVGSHLARLQLELGFEVLLSRITDLRLPDGMGMDVVVYAPGAALGPERLPLTFTKREA